jgi:putative flippase GtrA
MNIKRSGGVTTFLKAQVSAFIGGITDYTLMILLTEFVFLHYTLSILLSGAFGGLVNFTINRTWAFKSGSAYKLAARKQIIRFALVVSSSVLLKSAGTWIVTTFGELDYKVSRIGVDLAVSYFFNYPLMRGLVFTKEAENKQDFTQARNGFLSGIERAER